MKSALGQFSRDASDRLCFELFAASPCDHAILVKRVVEHFGLKTASKTVVGPDQIISGYSDGTHFVGLDWDNWSGFFVTAQSPNAEPLVRAIGAFLAKE